MRVSTKWEGNLAFTMTNPNGNELRMDARKEVGGDGSGVSPMEAVLGGLAGCMGIDMYMVLKPYQDKMTRMEIETDGTRNDESPKYFTAVEITVHVDGDVPASRVWRAVKLSDEKYCSVANSLKANLTYKVILNGEEVSA
ncbi:OsmC/Ohr family protein [Alkalibacterium sp. AK22]|uniref:OsmC family protein n=1 Tax=Alkalibacterium sp. AK22 TaxID=1229520 RepID=UPI00044B6363|nr:OsmC family protein [Alkalibacterium sp. AK22]EXJ24099.1 OsmC/Ohr family protein [Alkalibacterium sp. AK22]